MLLRVLLTDIWLKLVYSEMVLSGVPITAPPHRLCLFFLIWASYMSLSGSMYDIWLELVSSEMVKSEVVFFGFLVHL